MRGQHTHPLRVERLRRAWTQQQLADFAQVSFNSVVRAEQGKPLRVDICRLLCDALGKEKPEDLGLRCYGLPDASPTTEKQMVQIPAPTPPQEPAEQEDVTTVAQLVGTEGNVLDERLFFQETFLRSRRSMLHQLLAFACTTLVLSPTPLASLSETISFNSQTRDDLERITASYWRLCKNSSLDLLGNLTEHFRLVISLLSRPVPLDTAPRLYTLVGESAQILGKTLADLCEHPLAWSYYLFSLKAAQAAANHNLWAAGLGRMMLLLLYWERPAQACPLLQEVEQLTITSTRITAWLMAVKAEIHAHLGEADGCDHALDAAKTLVETQGLDEDCYAVGFTPSRLAGYEGACFLRLRQPERAVPALEQAVTLLDPQAIRRQSTLLTDMGIAYAQQGNVQAACQLATQALHITEQTKSQAIVKRIERLRHELEPWKELTIIQALDQQIARTLTLITAG